MAYTYTKRVLDSWDELPRSTLLAEQVRHTERVAAYWRHRARSAEQRMQQHDCDEATETETESK